MTTFRRTVRSFAEIAALHAEETGTDEGYGNAFDTTTELATLDITAGPTPVDMPEPQTARAAVEMVMQTLFEVFRDTRLEPYAADLAWGFCNSFHVVAKRIEGREDDAARELGELARAFDPSEIYAVEVEEKQTLTRTLMDARAAMECMRDHAAAVYNAETGRPFSTVRGSRVSQGNTALMIDARDFLAARAKARREQQAPTGPIVAFSGGMQWDNHELIWAKLDLVRARVPSMTLATTGMTKGCDAIAHAWAASREVPLIRFGLERRDGNRAGYLRNSRIVDARPVEAVLCPGSTVQRDLADKLRRAGVALTIVRDDNAARQAA